jgi:hypothetical protein
MIDLPPDGHRSVLHEWLKPIPTCAAPFCDRGWTVVSSSTPTPTYASALWTGDVPLITAGDAPVSNALVAEGRAISRSIVIRGTKWLVTAR